MPQVVAEIDIPVSPEVAFAVSQTTGELRLRWDPFIRHQHLLDGATVPARGVRTSTRAQVGPSMISRYVSYRPPTGGGAGNVGMTMESGPWFFEQFGGGWRFTPSDEGTHAVWKYTFSTKPAWLRPVADRIGTWLLGRQIRARIRGFAKGCADPAILAAVYPDG